MTEQALQVDRGLLVVGRLLDDRPLVAEATRRLDTLAERAFFYDGLWRGGDAPTHRRVLALLDGWIGQLVDDGDRPPATRRAPGGRSRAGRGPT